MRIFLSIWPLLIAAALLLSTNGMQSTALGLRGISEGFSTGLIGLLVSIYSLGFIFGCQFAPRFIASVGHIRAFVAFASIASAAALAHAIYVDQTFWLILRFISGFSFAAIQMILESWLNETADNKSRGKVLSIYRITDFSTVTMAQAAIGLFDPDKFVIFAVISIAFSISLVPIALTRISAPQVPASVKLDLRGLWKLSPMAAAASVTVGLTSSSFWSMSPVFVTGLNYDGSVTGLFLGAIILGGAVAQWPIGWLSDQMDRRRVLMVCAAGALITAGFLPFGAMQGNVSILVLGAFTFGVFALCTFGLAVAHANDHAAPGTSVQVNGGLLMLHGSAAVVGPMGASFVMRMAGPQSLFFWIAAIYAVLFVFSAYRLFKRAAPERTDSYVPVPRTSPAVFGLDPRGDTEAEAPDETAGAKPAPAATTP